MAVKAVGREDRFRSCVAKRSAWVMRIDFWRYDLFDIFSRIEGTVVSGTFRLGDWRGAQTKPSESSAKEKEKPKEDAERSVGDTVSPRGTRNLRAIRAVSFQGVERSPVNSAER
jgi:hypothetical protein